jgi:hypothetical protein
MPFQLFDDLDRGIGETVVVFSVLFIVVVRKN